MHKNKSILLGLFVGFLLGVFAFAEPIDSVVGGYGTEFCEEEQEPLNTDYITRTSTGKGDRQNLNVLVGYGTDFDAGARLVIDATFEEEYIGEDPRIIIASCSGYGYMWMHVFYSDVGVGRHTIEWTNQEGQGGTYSYAPLIDGVPASHKQSTWWQLWDNSYPLTIGKIHQNTWSGSVPFSGLYHSVKLYDKYGVLRHCWMPDPSGLMFDIITETYSTNEFGRWDYGDLAE